MKLFQTMWRHCVCMQGTVHPLKSELVLLTRGPVLRKGAYLCARFATLSSSPWLAAQPSACVELRLCACVLRR